MDEVEELAYKRIDTISSERKKQQPNTYIKLNALLNSLLDDFGFGSPVSIQILKLIQKEHKQKKKKVFHHFQILIYVSVIQCLTCSCLLACSTLEKYCT